MKKFILTTLLVVLSVFAYTQDLYAESFHSGEKADLSDQEEGVITKMYFYFDEMYIDYLVKDLNEDLEIDARLVIKDMRKRSVGEDKTSYELYVAFSDGEDLGLLEITLIEDGDNLFAAKFLDFYMVGKYIKKK